MKLIIIHDNTISARDGARPMLRCALASEPLGRVVAEGLIESMHWGGPDIAVPFIPEGWDIAPDLEGIDLVRRYEDALSCRGLASNTGQNAWCFISNGRFFTRIEGKLIERALNAVDADVVALNADPGLLAACEKIRLTAGSRVGGVRRLYEDSIEAAPVPEQWPHHLCIKREALAGLLSDGMLPLAFPALLDMCGSNKLKVIALRLGGAAMDLETQAGLLRFCSVRLRHMPAAGLNGRSRACRRNEASQHDETEGGQPRLIGRVLLGRDVQIQSDAVVIGPTIVCSGARIARRATINSSIIGPGVQIPKSQFVQNQVLTSPEPTRKKKWQPQTATSRLSGQADLSPALDEQTGEVFRSWPITSYARCFKRIADSLAATAVLMLFAPVIPVIAAAIKFTSPGPVFFKHRRQGMHGKCFNCIKFRTMHAGADKIQDRLRSASHVDGPQFKIDDDPRISAVGRFLRETYLDEIPQFFNVLMGQMSVVGPRPSPEAENRLCPPWRDARLSVRPGITGLWQICRTRRPMKDFQEWIYYDTKYVRELSLGTDLRICWLTFKKMVEQFTSQF